MDLSEFETCEIHKGNFILYKNQSYDSKQQNFLVTESTPEVQFFKELYRKMNSFNPIISFEISSWGVLKKMADASLGIALIPDFLISNSEKKNIVKSYKLTNYRIVAAWPKSRELNIKCRKFLEFLNPKIFNNNSND